MKINICPCLHGTMDTAFTKTKEYIYISFICFPWYYFSIIQYSHIITYNLVLLYFWHMVCIFLKFIYYVEAFKYVHGHGYAHLYTEAFCLLIITTEYTEEWSPMISKNCCNRYKNPRLFMFIQLTCRLVPIYLLYYDYY